MTKYILHGGYTRVDNDLNQTFYEEIARDVPSGGTILLCYFALIDGDHSERFAFDQEKLSAAAFPKKLRFVVASPSDFISQLENCDALYILGGSTPKLLRALVKHKLSPEILSGKTVAGSSAGAYAIGSYSAFHDDESGGDVRQGLGWLPLRVVCHFESHDLPPNPNALEKLLKLPVPDEVVYLRDCEWKVFIEINVI